MVRILSNFFFLRLEKKLKLHLYILLLNIKTIINQGIIYNYNFNFKVIIIIFSTKEY